MSGRHLSPLSSSALTVKGRDLPRKQRAAPGTRSRLALSPMRPPGQACGTGGGLSSSLLGDQPTPPPRPQLPWLTMHWTESTGRKDLQGQRERGVKSWRRCLSTCCVLSALTARRQGVTSDLSAKATQEQGGRGGVSAAGGRWESGHSAWALCWAAPGLMLSAVGTGPADLGCQGGPSSPTLQV